MGGGDKRWCWFPLEQWIIASSTIQAQDEWRPDESHAERIQISNGDWINSAPRSFLFLRCSGWISGSEVKKWSRSVVSDSLSCPTLCRVWLFATPWTVAYQALPSMGFSRQEYWSGFAISFSRGSSRPRNRTWVSRAPGRRFNLWATRDQWNWLLKHSWRFRPH